MTDVETLLRSRLHEHLDELLPSTLTTQHALRAGHRARRRRTAIVAATAAIALIGGTATGAALLRRGGSQSRDSVVAAPGLADRTAGYAEQFRAGNFAGIRADMTPGVRAQLSEQQIRSAWQMALDTFGPFVRLSPAIRDADSRATYLSRLTFDKGDVNLRVTYDGDGAVIGITLLSAQVEKLATVPPNLAGASRQIVDDLAQGHYDRVRNRFDDNMMRFLSVAQLRAGWQKAAVQEHGGFVSTGGMTATHVLGATVVDVFCTMRHGELKVRITFDSSGAVSGLFLQTP